MSGIFRSLRRFGFFMSFNGRFQLPRTLLRRAFRLANYEVSVDDFDGKYHMRLRLSEHMQRRIFWMGYYSTDIVALLKNILEPGMTVIDVGANIGEITLVAAQRVGNEGKVFAFEPVGATADRLVDHVRINGLKQVQIKRKALGRVAGRVPMYLSCGQGVADENQGLASLYRGSVPQDPIEYVDVITLDSVVTPLNFQRVDLIKIDVEGGELACLRGAENVLRHFRPLLIVEVQAFAARQAGWEVEELFDYLRGFGYEFFIIGSKGHLDSLKFSALVEFQNVFCRVREDWDD